MKKIIELILNKPDLYKERTYTHNAVIFNEGDICNYISIVIKGEIKISVFNNGHEDIINTISQDQFFGDILLFSNSPIYLGMGIAKFNTKIIYISKDNLFKYFVDNQFLNLFLNEICDKSLQLKQINKLLSYNKIKDRILFYLTEESKKNKSKVIYLKSITKLSELLNIPRPSLSRELSKLHNEGIIIKNKKTIYLK